MLLKTLANRILSLFRRRQRDAQLAEEIQHHLDSLADHLEQGGLSPQEARREAQRQFGNVTQTRETYRGMQGVAWLDNLFGDLRLSVRMLLRTPGLAFVAILAVALGVGANTAVFSLLDQVLYRMLPVHQPERLVRLHQQGGLYGNSGAYQLSYPMFRELASGQKVFSDVFARFLSTANLSIDGQAERVWVEAISGNFYAALGLRAHIGRLIDPAHEREYGAVLTYSYWKTRFDSDPRVLGRTLLLNRKSYTIIGVSMPGFEGMEIHPTPQIRIPAATRPELDVRGARVFNVYARLAPGVSLEQAQIGLQPAYHAALEEEAPNLPYLQEDSSLRRRFLSGSVVLRSAAQGDMSRRNELVLLSLVLLVIVATVLLIACANIANLLLARATARQKEIAMRLALGAPRWRLIRQLLMESTLLSLAGGVAGLGVSYLTLRYALTFAPPEMPTNVVAEPDFRVLLFNFCIAAVTGLIFGLLPALASTRPDVAPVLKDLTATASSGASQHLLRKSLVTVQIALSLSLLIVAGLLVRSLAAIKQSDPGFRLNGLIVFNVNPRMNGYSDEAVRNYRTAMEVELRKDPSVEDVAYGRYAVLSGDSRTDAFRTIGGEVQGPAQVDLVNSSFFRTLALPLLAGREFGAQDSLAGPRVAIINEAFAKRFFATTNPIGQFFAYAMNKGNGTRFQVIGVARNARTLWVKADPDPQVYLYSEQEKEPAITAFYVRHRGDAAPVFPTIRNAVRLLDPALPTYGMRTMDLQFDTRLSAERMAASMATGFGSLAGILAMVGLFGVMSYLVSRRTREIGIRITLGAGRACVIGMVIREALIFGGVGIGCGLLIASAIARLLRWALFGLTPLDPPTYAVAVALMVLVILASTAIPAWRASRVDPLVALRHS